MTNINNNYFTKLAKTYTSSSANANLLTLAIAFSYDCLTARDNVPCFGVQLFLVMGMDIQ